MSWLDSFLDAIAYVQAAGLRLPQRNTLNFTNATVTDDPANGRTNVTVSTLATPTGTGFVHVTSGVTDGAASNVALASQVSGTLPLANLTHGTAGQLLATNAAATAPVWATCAGDVSASTGTPGVMWVGSISGAGGAGGTCALTCDALEFTTFGTTTITQNSGTVVTGSTIQIIAETGVVTGGVAQLLAGDGPARGSARLGYANGVPMVDVAEVGAGHRVVALCQTSGTPGVTSTQVPGTGSDGVAFLWNANAVPAQAPVGGYLLYAQAGALMGIGTSNTTVTIGPAEPHCPVCGTDFGHEWSSPTYGTLQVCMSCLADHLGNVAWIRRTRAGQ